eukprot:jgi/Botrbrau1/2499/Bobra.0226s0055.1
MVEEVQVHIAEEGRVEPRHVIRRSYLGLIPLLFMVAFLTYLDRGSVSFGSLQFSKDLEMSSAEYGTGSGIFYIGYALFQIPSNLVLMKAGAGKWLPLMVFGFGMIAAVSSTMTSRTSFYILRFFLGTFEAGCFPGIWYHLSTFFNSLELGFAYAASSSATAVGQMLGAPLAAGLLMMDGMLGLRGWQWIFIIEGAITMAYSIILYCLLARSPARAWFLKPQERQWLSERQHKALEYARSRNPDAGTKLAVFRSWKIWYLSINYMLVQFSTVPILYFNPLIVESMFHGGHGWRATAKVQQDSPRDQLLHEARIALISAVLWIPVIIFMLLLAYTSKHFNERNLHCAVPLTVAGVSFMLVTTALDHGGPIAGYAVLIVAASAVESILGAIWSWPKTFLHGNGAGVGIALFNSMGAIGAFAGPFVVGRLVELPGGYRTAMIVLGAVNFLNAFALFCFRPGDDEGLYRELVISTRLRSCQPPKSAQDPPCPCACNLKPSRPRSQDPL